MSRSWDRSQARKSGQNNDLRAYLEGGFRVSGDEDEDGHAKGQWLRVYLARG